MALTVYVAEDGLVGHQWEESPVKVIFHSIGARVRKQEWVGWGAGEDGKVIGDFWRENKERRYHLKCK